MPEPDEAAAEAKAVGAASRALARELGLTRVTLHCQGEGLTNHVFRVRTRRGSFVVRLGVTPGKESVFAREQATIEQVRKVGVPVNETLAVGRSGDWSYMISRHVPGEAAVHHPRQLEIVEELGRLAARVHSVRTVGYGFAFKSPNGNDPADPSWSGWIDQGLHASRRLQSLRDREMISPDHADTLQATLREVKAWADLPVLNHGDLRLKNVLVNAEGKVQALIDWEDSVSSIGPHWDISIALHDLSIDAKEAFLRGYGMPEKTVRGAAPVWRLFNALNYAPTVDAAAEVGDSAALDRLRTRLAGALDLYAG